MIKQALRVGFVMQLVPLVFDDEERSRSSHRYKIFLVSTAAVRR
ncbi:MAG: hypothetical protein ACTHK4_13575 [Mycobacteriales bacterium]